jgi:hypothetical protein
MFFIYVSELQEEAPMDKKHRKREKKAYTRNITLIYTEKLREIYCQISRLGKKYQKHEDRGST